jgi:DNA repair exonuclease SbcCD nuclease subunit
MQNEIDSDVIAIACADTHLDEYAWSDRHEIRGDSMWSFKWITQLACAKGVPLIIAGDVFDKQLNNATVVGYAAEQIADIATVFIQGQHCFQKPYPWLSQVGPSSDNDDGYTEWIGGDPGDFIRIHGVEFRGADWMPANKVQARLDQITPSVDVMVMHQVTKQLMKEMMEQIKTFELDVTLIPFAKLLILGDFHRTRILKVQGATGQALTVISPGSTNMRSIDEPSDKYVFLIKKDLTFDRVQIPTRPKLESIIETEEDLKAFCRIGGICDWTHKDATEAGVPEHISKPLVWVKFNPDLQLAYQRIRDAVGDHGHLFTAPISQEKQEEESLPAGDENEEMAMAREMEDIGPLACLPLRVNKEEDPAAFSLLQRLLTEPDPQAVLAEERKRYIS